MVIYEIQVGGDRVNVEILWQNVLKEIKDELSKNSNY